MESKQNVNVLKFGGSSLSTAERIVHVSKIIQQYLDENILPVVVLSAMDKTTSKLIDLANASALGNEVSVEPLLRFHLNILKDLQIDSLEVEQSIQQLFKTLAQILQAVALLKELTSATKDLIMSFGERLSVRVISGYLNHINITSKYLDAHEIGLILKGNVHGSCTKQITKTELHSNAYKNIKNHLTPLILEKIVPIITGFIAKNENNQIVTLGRGGSDYSASIIGAAISSDAVHIWTDTNGILTGDPKCVTNSTTIPFLSFVQASELAYFGGKVLHPRSIQPAVELSIPIYVKNSYNRQHPGTIISKKMCQCEGSKYIVALTLKSPVTLFDIKATQMMGQFGFLSEVFSVFQECELSVDVIATSEISISVTFDKDVDPYNVQQAKKKISKIADVNVMTEKSILTLIGDTTKLTQTLELACKTLSNINISIDMVSISASRLNISIVLSLEESCHAMEHLHAAFFN